MIISFGRQYIFVHIPKTGGTSLALALEGRAMADDILIGDTPKAKRRRRRLAKLTPQGRLWKHAKLADAQGVVTPAQMQDFMVFTLVRNPWDRMVSYHSWLRGQGFDHVAVRMAKALDFNDFIQHPTTRIALETNPYTSYVACPDGADLCDHYVRLEHLRADLAPVEARLGFAFEIPHVNRSERVRDWRESYNAASQDVVARACAPDIARFGYSFDT